MPIITALPNYAALNSVSDVLPIVDITNNVTKKVPWSVLQGLVTDITTTYKWRIAGTTLILNNGSDVFAIDIAGSVAIGTNVPEALLTLTGGDLGGGLLVKNKTTLAYVGFVGNYSSFIGIGSNDKFTVSSFASRDLLFNPLGGNVGIGTAIPGEKLEVNGNVKPTGYKSSDGSQGVSGSFTTVDLKTVTVKDGIITSIV